MNIVPNRQFFIAKLLPELKSVLQFGNQRPGLRKAAGSNLAAAALPVQKLANTASLAFACDEFLIVTQRDQPSLAAEGAHLADMIDIHQRVPVNSLEGCARKPVLDHFERLSGKVLALGRYDPDQVAFGLKRVDLIGAQ